MLGTLNVKGLGYILKQNNLVINIVNYTLNSIGDKVNKMADKYYIKQHIKHVCSKYLIDDSILYCATCPFEDEIIGVDSSLKDLFIKKRQLRKNKNY